jgi:hypothetical protein
LGPSIAERFQSAGDRSANIRDHDDPKDSVSHPANSTTKPARNIDYFPSRDSRIPTLIRNGLQEKKRSFFVVVGDHSKDAIVHLYYIMSSMDVRQNKSVLWAYKNKLLGFTSHRKKRENKIKKEIKRGTREANSEDPFELFISLNDIRYTYYKETDKILGNTYGMVSGTREQAVWGVQGS